jgi:hypothetical protein
MSKNSNLDDETLQGLAAAVATLGPQPRQRRWVSLALCVADAVWSIGAHYDNVVTPLVRKLANEFGVTEPTVPGIQPLGTDPLPLKRLAALRVDELTSLTNHQRTSTRGGILKSEAVLEHYRVFLDHDVESLDDIPGLFADAERFTAVDNALRSIPGEGGHGIRRNYLWMVVGQDDLIKPDRMVLRWFGRQGVSVDPAGARDAIAAFVPLVSTRLGRTVTAWEIDHAMWQSARRR